MHEIITLQFGQQANYIGTHYWNTQESYFTYAGQDESPVDHDISFRAGIGADGQDTYTPRTLIYDLKGAFGTLKRENALYELQQQDQHGSRQAGGWAGTTMPLQLPPIAPSSYQQALDQGQQAPQLGTESVRFWSDYNHLFYHPKSIVQLSEYELNSSLMPFERWDTGQELFANLDREHDLLDRDIRPFLEECDQLQGLQVLSGIDDAWGGFAAKYLERIADEMGKGCRWVFGLQDGRRVTRERQMLQMLNTAQSLSALHSSASMHLPITSVPARLPGYVEMDGASAWHTSALQAAAVESVTLPTRLRRAEAGRATFGDLETTLSNDGNRRLAALGLTASVAEDLEEQGQQVNGHEDSRMTNGYTNGRGDEHEQPANKLDIDFFPDIASSSRAGRTSERRTHTFSTVESLRGPWKSPDDIADTNADSRDRRRFADGPRATTHQTNLLFPLLTSYPQIFRFRGQEMLALKASVSTSTAVADRIRSLEGTARRVVGLEERETLCDGLVGMAEEYEEGWSGDEEEGDDD
ncbi:hypothetical protein LTR36_003411 [Oleoguttula mirabilis]|uniref:Tubulin nucleotide-binding domain-like protein n=1 Tax=Oleoguttula mirabilis TaxID=1507867 RepID=A0AAV9JIL6_9PEZI|nr:hypothetical protein LTR36_003411 [Oleoguttula mirabilis]